MMIPLTFRERLFWFFVLILSLLFFRHTFTVFFSADDFYNMYLAKNGIGDVVSSFLFVPRSDFLFYRPLSTQFYFYLAKPFFGFNPLGYHIISFIVFWGILIAVYKLTKLLFKQTTIALIAVAIYFLSPTNITRLSWIVQMQELMLGLFGLFSLYFWTKFLITSKKSFYVYSLLLFVLSLMSKETAIIIPLLFALTHVYLIFDKSIRFSIKPYIVVGVLAALYLYLRLFVLGVSTGQHYFTDYSIKGVMNTIMWYGLWSMGIPEYLVDIKIFQGFGINPYLVNEIWSNFPMVGIGFIGIIVLLLFIMVRTFITSKSKKNIVYTSVFGFGIFIICLLPQLFSPLHKFSYSLTLPLYGIALLVAFFLSRYCVGRKIGKLFIVFLIIVLYGLISYSTIHTEEKTHWVFKRATLSKQIVDYLSMNYSEIPHGSTFVFINGDKQDLPEFGVSKQIAQTLAGDKAMKLLYDDSSISVYYEDLPPPPKEFNYQNTYILSSPVFLNSQ